MDLSRRIILKMDAMGLNITELSKASLVPYSTLSKFLRNKHTISSDKLLRILKALDFDLISELEKSLINSNSDKMMPKYMRKTLWSFFKGGIYGPRLESTK